MSQSGQAGPFPADFAWGQASSSYQCEGAAHEEGRGESVWDVYCRKDGAIFSGVTGDVANDHYHHIAGDIDLMRQFGLRASRFSIAWPRVLPQGTGTPNETGLAFYDRMVDAYLAAGIEPWVTLFHWDFPMELHRRGGWLNRDSADWFADYATLVVRRLGDRVTNWMTLNEPQVFIGMGLHEGTAAPGDKLEIGEVVRAGHHVLLAHGRAVQVIRAGTRQSRVGYAPIGRVRMPATDSAADVDAARQAMFSAMRRDFHDNGWWSDPVVLGTYPEDAIRLLGVEPPVRPGDMATIAQPLDFYGANIYSGHYVRAGADGRPERLPDRPGWPANSLNWPLQPAALYWGPRLFAERYGLPVVVTENGFAGRDWVGLDGRVHDLDRIDYLRRYLLELGRAIGDGVPVLGYFHWTFVDDFEWMEGFKDRFGLVHCDFETLERTAKDSAYWYRDVIASNGLALDEDWLPSAPTAKPA